MKLKLISESVKSAIRNQKSAILISALFAFFVVKTFGAAPSVINGTARNAYGSPVITNITVTPLSTPTIYSTNTLYSAATNATSDASGNFSLSLYPGDYTVQIGTMRKDSFIIGVTNAGATYRIEDIIKTDLTYTATVPPSYELKSNKAQPLGYASLGSDGKVPSSQLPPGNGGGSVSLNANQFGVDGAGASVIQSGAATTNQAIINPTLRGTTDSQVLTFDGSHLSLSNAFDLAGFNIQSAGSETDLLYQDSLGNRTGINFNITGETEYINWPLINGPSTAHRFYIGNNYYFQVGFGGTRTAGNSTNDGNVISIKGFVGPGTNTLATNALSAVAVTGPIDAGQLTSGVAAKSVLPETILYTDQSQTAYSIFGNGTGSLANPGYSTTGDFLAHSITAPNLLGNASYATNSATATNATNFTGSLSGQVTGTQGATVVSSVPSNALPSNVVFTNGIAQNIYQIPLFTNGLKIGDQNFLSFDGTGTIRGNTQHAGNGGGGHEAEMEFASQGAFSLTDSQNGVLGASQNHFGASLQTHSIWLMQYDYLGSASSFDTMGLWGYTKLLGFHNRFGNGTALNETISGFRSEVWTNDNIPRIVVYDNFAPPSGWGQPSLHGTQHAVANFSTNGLEVIAVRVTNALTASNLLSGAANIGTVTAPTNLNTVLLNATNAQFGTGVYSTSPTAGVVYYGAGTATNIFINQDAADTLDFYYINAGTPRRMIEFGARNGGTGTLRDTGGVTALDWVNRSLLGALWTFADTTNSASSSVAGPFYAAGSNTMVGAKFTANVTGTSQTNSGALNVAGNFYGAGSNTLVGANITSNLSYATATGKQITLASSNIDASTGAYFFRQLAANTPFALTGMTDGATITLVVANASTYTTTYTGFTWPSNAVTPLPTPGTSVITVVRVNGTNFTTSVTNFP